MAEFEVGQKVRVLPGARSATETGDYDYYPVVTGDKTGLVAGGPGRYGDYDVEDDDGFIWAFAQEFLEAIKETPTVRVGDKVRVTVTFDGDVSVVYPTGGFEVDDDVYVEAGTEVEILERALVAPKVGDFVDPEGEYDTGTVAVLDNNPQSVVVSQGGNWEGNLVGSNFPGALAKNRWKIIYIPEEAK